jgi:HKD family nuclease
MVKFISTQAKKYREKEIERSLFSFHRAKKITIVSAYVDYKSISNVVDICNQQRNGNILLKIFSDKHSIKKLYNKYPEEMKGLFDSIGELQEGSGIFSVNYGKLFHTKCYQIDTRATRTLKERIITILGSLNFTQNGFYENEEILYKVSDFKQSNEKDEIHNHIGEYINTIEQHSATEKCSIENLQKNQRNSNLRDLLLNGYLRNEIRENETLSIDLNIEDEFRRTVSKKHPALEDTTSNVLKIEKLIATDDKLKSLIELPEKCTTHSSWKRFCIYTDYGYWSPINFKERIDNEIAKRDKASYYKTLVAIIEDYGDALQAAFLRFCTELEPQVGGDNWKLSNKEVAKEHWDKKYKKLLKKLGKKNFIKRLSNKIDHASVPDLWNDEIASKEFEDSFLEEILYISNKDRYKNEVVKSIKNLFDNVGETNFNKKPTEDLEDLKESLEAALKKTDIEDIFDYEN